MKLPASTQKIIAELKEAFATSRFDEGLVREGFEEHLELLKLPKRAIVFHPNPVLAILKVYELSRDAARAAAWDAAWAAAWDAARAAARAAARDAAWDAAWAAARDAARDAAWAAAWAAARAAAWDAAGAAAWDAARAAARDAARDAARAAAWAAARDAAWDAAWDAAGAAAWDAARANPWMPFFKIVKGGCLFFWVTRDAVHVAQAQIFSMSHPSGQRRLHYEMGPAIEYRDGSGLWFWKGTQVTEQTILRPETFKAEGILAEQNAEVRRIQIERFGMERFLREANAKVIHSHEMGKLYSLDLPNDPDRKLKAVLVKDPSTNREYFLRIPPNINNVKEGIAWTFNMKMHEYNPMQET